MFGTEKETQDDRGRSVEYLIQEEEGKLLDMDQVTARRWNAPSRWALFLSTKSKKSPAANAGHGPDVSREGVQRDILPIIEGTTVNTRYGMIRTDHIFVRRCGVFTSLSRRPDPELQGRLRSAWSCNR